MSHIYRNGIALVNALYHYGSCQDVDVGIYECGMNRIRELREAAGLTTQQLADRVGTSQPQITRLETGGRRLTLHWMQRLADALNVEPQDLIAPAPMARFTNEARRIEPIDPIVKAALRGTGREAYEIKAKSINRKGIDAGDKVVVEPGPDSATNLPDGALVIAEVFDVASRKKKLIVRQFVAPALLILNSHDKTGPSVDLFRHDVKIVGVIITPHQ